MNLKFFPGGHCGKEMGRGKQKSEMMTTTCCQNSEYVQYGADEHLRMVF